MHSNQARRPEPKGGQDMAGCKHLRLLKFGSQGHLMYGSSELQVDGAVGREA